MSDWTPNLKRLQEFDDGEWLRVERHYCGRLLAYVSRRVADTQAREDIVQETFLGSVRGIENFDTLYTFEQYLFGICRNRTIDYLRRNKTQTIQSVTDSEDIPGLEVLAKEDETPSRIVRGEDLARQGRELLVNVLRDWVQETWQQGEFVRLMVIEALFSGGWRNRDTWERFSLRDETAVAGIKFRALKRMRELAGKRDSQGKLLFSIKDAEDGIPERLDYDVAQAWREGLVSCPARYWLARILAGTLSEGPKSFIEFHLEEMQCEWCLANKDDLVRAEQNLDPILDKVRASTVQYLRSKTLEA